MCRLGIIFTVLLTMGLVACNGHDPSRRNSDPLKEYPDLKTYIPPAEVPAQVTPQEQPRTQVFKSQLFDVRLDQESTTSMVLHFVAGERTRHVIKVRTFVDGVKASLKTEGLPNGAHFTEAPDQPGTWILEWAPPFDLVGPRMSTWEGQFQIEYVIAAGTPAPQAELFKGEEKKMNVAVLVARSSRQPILTVNLPKGPFPETQPVLFTVDVMDPVGGTKQAPDVFITWEPENQTAEKKLFPGHQGVVRDPNKLKPVAQQDGSWRFFYVYKPWIVAEEARRAGHKDKVHAEFLVIANSSVSDHSSTSPTQEVEIQMTQGSAQ
ncbi:MAG: hypothetical protein H6624_01970 [Bdellovibrionaceae bacterium]|nr:hypothetical protein [Bdellovibrionales bacterium]MCB9083076.1 hypothetical protein [Pseudobdellovibrionaceae bacterium]